MPRAELAALEARLVEHMRDRQTGIVRAFHPYCEGQNIRMRAVEARVSHTETGLGERVAIVQQRLLEIGKRLLMNPPAAWPALHFPRRCDYA